MAPTTVIDNTTVAGAWLRAIDGIPDNKINTVLPDVALWADTGFVQVVGTVGGTPWLDAPVRSPVIEIDTWGARANTEKPDWGKASVLMELIMTAATGPRTSVDVRFPIGDRTVRILSCWAVSEPRKPITGIDTGDVASFARLAVDLQFMWTVLP
jgi:hypothetical protein